VQFPSKLYDRKAKTEKKGNWKQNKMYLEEQNKKKKERIIVFKSPVCLYVQQAIT
jgi:ribosomal protein L18